MYLLNLKNFVVFNSLMCLSLSICAQTSATLTWNGTIGTSSNPAAITPGVATLGSGLELNTNAPCGNTVLSSQGIWDVGNADPSTLANALADGEYVEFPITAGANAITLTQITFLTRRAQNGPNEAYVFGYDGSNLTDLNGIAPITTENCNTGIFTTVGFDDLIIPAGEVRYLRLYPVGATNNGASWRVGSVTINATVNTPLAVKMGYIKGEYRDKQNRITFGTEEEINNDYFEIERSADNQAYHTIGFLPSKGGNHDYLYIDVEPMSGKNYYRVKQIDLDGRMSIFEPLLIHTEGKEMQLTWSQHSIEVFNLIDKAELLITHSQGAVISKKTIQNEESIDISDFVPGVYMVIITQRGGKIVHKVRKYE
jgi:hypothetical protein